MDKQLMNDTLDSIVEKFRQIDLLNQLNDNEGIADVLETISEFEIRVLENMGKNFLEMAENIKYLKTVDKSELQG